MASKGRFFAKASRTGSSACRGRTRSTLFTARNTGLSMPSRTAKTLSSRFVPSVASTTTTTTSALSAALRASAFMYSPSLRWALCTPGVSTMTSCDGRPRGRVITASTRSRVVSGAGVTMEMGSPTSALRSVLLPAFGRPSSAT